jgi:S1-C subfamily serine protease
VVSIAIKGRANSATITSLSKGQPVQRAGSRIDGPANRQMRATGSGVVIDPGEGIILTNAHVIDGADEITVIFAEGRELQARRVGSDAGADVVVIQVDAQLLPAIPIGNSDKLEVGDFVLAIGNRFPIGQTVTSGIVSGLHRSKLGFGKAKISFKPMPPSIREIQEELWSISTASSSASIRRSSARGIPIQAWDLPSR